MRELPDRPPQATPGASDETPPAEPLRVVLAEDDAGDAELIRRELEQQGLDPNILRVQSEPTFRAALQARPDLVIADHAMPHLSGQQALDIYRQSGLDAPFILVSGLVPDDQGIAMMRAGAADFVPKSQLSRLGPVVARELADMRRRRELHRVGEAMARERRLLEESQRLANVGGWLIDVREQRLYWTEGTYAIHGLEPGRYDPEVSSAIDFYHPDFRPVVQRAVARALASGEPFDFEARLIRADGREIWVRARGTTRREDGRIVEVYGAIQDVTAQIESTQVLRATEQRYRAARESSLDALYILEAGIGTGEGLRIADVNRAGERLFNRPRARLVGLRLDELLPSERDAEFLRMCRRVARSLAPEEQVIQSDSFGGRARWLRHQVIPIVGGVAVTSRDVTAERRSQEELRYLAEHDVLTGLPNRNLLIRELSRVVTETEFGGQGALLLMDFDRFKEINDSLGHRVGDRLLKLMGGRVRELAPEQACVSRLGGDEFAIAVARLEDDGSPVALAQRLLEGFRGGFSLDGKEVFITPSIGVVPLPCDTRDPEELLRLGDIAMYRAKREGGGTFEVHQRDDAPEHARKRLDMANLLRYALERGQMYLEYQPQVDVASGRVVGFEALLRWRPPELGPVRPDLFIPLAEESGQIVEIGQWAFEECCRFGASLLDAGALLRFGVNLSARQFRSATLAEELVAIAERHRVPPGSLELEITESVLLHSLERTRRTLEAFDEAGIDVAIDDFGTGYSSLSYLKSFPVDALKVDRSFVKDIETDPDSRALVGAIVTMGRQLGLQVVAEGVETQAQLDFLRTLDCHRYQGWLFSRAVPGPAFAELLGVKLPADARDAGRPAP